MNFMGYVNDTILEDEDLNVTVQDVKFLESLSTRYYSAHAYVAVNYTDGDICLSTNVPRHVMVYYVCFDQFEPSIISISEVSTCVYQIAIGLQTLCSYERKVRNSQQRNIISCYQDELPKNDNLKIPAPNEMTVSELTELIETSLNLTVGPFCSLDLCIRESVLLTNTSSGLLLSSLNFCQHVSKEWTNNDMDKSTYLFLLENKASGHFWRPTRCFFQYTEKMFSYQNATVSDTMSHIHTEEIGLNMIRILFKHQKFSF
ncbi:uncharacterized protein LOC118761904 [Octopus sinensis]|uniref:Endoplasmic reticulum lectin 1 n=1 Tax=Octopus sinensis TaxID=2607531 RepID=A0A7E6EL16_9MOLL|nr:uncharacterized protein LOC118761904 [Octopus sinensis]